MVFSSNEDLDAGDQQTSLIPTVEEVTREEDGQAEDAGSEQQFGVFKDFDFLDVELEDAEVRTDPCRIDCFPSVSKAAGDLYSYKVTCSKIMLDIILLVKKALNFSLSSHIAVDYDT